MRCIRYKDLSGDFSVAKRKAVLYDRSIVEGLRESVKYARSELAA